MRHGMRSDQARARPSGDYLVAAVTRPPPPETGWEAETAPRPYCERRRAASAELMRPAESAAEMSELRRAESPTAASCAASLS